jgi:hypothetical protein
VTRAREQKRGGPCIIPSLHVYCRYTSSIPTDTSIAFDTCRQTVTTTMQRPTYANSPPLHHPVPQHVSTVPQLRSPPPPTTSANTNRGGYGFAAGQSPLPGQPQQPQQQQPGGQYMQHPAFGGFMNDSTAQMGFQIGKSAVDAGQQYVEQNVRGRGRI